MKLSRRKFILSAITFAGGLFGHRATRQDETAHPTIKSQKEEIESICADLMLRPGLINADYTDVCMVMRGMGRAVTGAGIATGTERARRATDSAIRALLLKDRDVTRASGVLVSLAAQKNPSLHEFSEVGDTVREFVAKDATVTIGTVIDPTLDDNLRVAIALTGLDGRHCPAINCSDLAIPLDGEPAKQGPFQLVKQPNCPTCPLRCGMD